MTKSRAGRVLEKVLDSSSKTGGAIRGAGLGLIVSGYLSLLSPDYRSIPLEEILKEIGIVTGMGAGIGFSVAGGLGVLEKLYNRITGYDENSKSNSHMLLQIPGILSANDKRKLESLVDEANQKGLFEKLFRKGPNVSVEGYFVHSGIPKLREQEDFPPMNYVDGMEIIVSGEAYAVNQLTSGFVNAMEDGKAIAVNAQQLQTTYWKQPKGVSAGEEGKEYYMVLRIPSDGDVSKVVERLTQQGLHVTNALFTDVGVLNESSRGTTGYKLFVKGLFEAIENLEIRDLVSGSKMHVAFPWQF